MTRIMIAAAAAAAALLAGCSAGEGDADAGGDVTAAEVAQKAEAAGIKPQPGLYKTTLVMTGLEIPGAPADLEGHGAGMTTTTETCLTQADVDKGFEELMKQGQSGECRYERFDIAGGDIDAVMVCATPQGEARMEMDGTVSATRAQYNATMKVDMGEVGMTTMSFTGQQERVGDCPAP